jgi:hypothetical protein
MKQDNYLSRKHQLLRGFDKSLNRVRVLLYSWLGAEQAEILIRDSRQEYEVLIPRIPFIGRRNPLLVFFLPTTRYLAIYRSFTKQGLTIEDAGYLAFEIGTEELKSIPSIVRHFISYLWFSPWFLKRIKKRAMETQHRMYPGNYVMTFVEGNGREFAYGVDYIECASCKFLEAENALELAPFVCAVDKTASELLGWGLKRTMALAKGSLRCDFRFTKGGETHVEIPQSLEDQLRLRSV